MYLTVCFDHGNVYSLSAHGEFVDMNDNTICDQDEVGIQSLMEYVPTSYCLIDLLLGGMPEGRPTAMGGCVFIFQQTHCAGTTVG